MYDNAFIQSLKLIELDIDGIVLYDDSSLMMYATDASVYKEYPIAVVLPANKEDVKLLILFAKKHGVSLVFRAAGTSLAGQCVGDGIVVDVSRFMNRILEINVKESCVCVEPGVVLLDLNKTLEKDDLFFGPETSTSNRCTIGGMAANNSAGLHSLLYGSTRDQIVEIKAILSDGSEAVFRAITNEEFQKKINEDSLEARLYQNANEILGNESSLREIDDNFPLKEIDRRNSGYALDLLAATSPFDESSNNSFNFCSLLSGSEGTLAFIYELTLSLVPLPHNEKALLCVHFNSLDESLRAVPIAKKNNAVAIELMDHLILDLTKENIEQKKNRFFIKGNPKAILMIEFASSEKMSVLEMVNKQIAKLKEAGYGYHYPIVEGEDVQKVWNLRKAGLGVLSNMKGDAKPVSVTEDVAVSVDVLPDFVNDYKTILDELKLQCVFYGHAGSGLLHIKPVLNLKTKEGQIAFITIAEKTAILVKKYKGSLSGEHGDGRLRGSFLETILTKRVYSFFLQVKNAWDPDNIFNPGKIVNAKSVNSFLRFSLDKNAPEIETIFNFSDSGGLMRALEKCNGSADCRKSVNAEGTMCPTYRATLDEKYSTRARVNVIRESILNSIQENPLTDPKIFEILSLCISCKGCLSECPSNVDMAMIKAECFQHYYDKNGVNASTRLFAYNTGLNKVASKIPAVYNWAVENRILGKGIKMCLGISSNRNLPKLYKLTLIKWININKQKLKPIQPIGKLYLFCDEFTNYYDVQLGIKSILLLSSLGYEVMVVDHFESGRALISNGLLRRAKKVAAANIDIFSKYVSAETPLIGIEPSAILTFRDEYVKLADETRRKKSKKIASNTLMIDEFIIKEIENGNICKEQFGAEKKKILLHGHCHQKSLASIKPTEKLLSFPYNHIVEIVPSGCCGMAGSFGYEKHNYKLSMKIGEMILFPFVRKSVASTIISAPGISCRQQIYDGTGRKAVHPIEILFDSLLKE